MWRYALTLAPSDTDADGVCQSQDPAGAGDLTINGALASGGVATFGAAQLVTITAGTNESGHTFTVYGTDVDGNTQSEAITGPNATTVTGTKYFKTVTRVAVSGNSGAITVGVVVTSISKALRAPLHADHFAVGIGCSISGTITYSVQQTYDDFPAGGTIYPTNWFEHATVTGKSAAFDGSLLFPCTAFRLRVTAATSGSVTAAFVAAQ